MRRTRLAWIWTSMALLTAACGDSSSTGGGGAGAGGGAGGDNPTGPTGLPCDVSKVLQDHCQSCHGSTVKFGAPMSLVTRDDLLATPPTFDATTVGAAAVARTAANEMPPPPNALLTAEEQATLESYVTAGMPEITETCDGQGGAGGGGGGYDLGCTPDVDLSPTTPFEMPSDQTDLYVCFGVEVPSDITQHITAIAPHIDNETIVHHILFLQSPTAVSAQGEPCGFTNTNWKLLYAWAPGAPPMVLPPEAGYPIGPSEPGHFVIQVHYNNINGLVGEKDQSGMSLCTTTQLRANDADIMALGGMNFTLPPNQTTTVDCSTDVPSVAGAFFPVTVFQSWPHMHQVGKSFKSEIVRSDNSTVTLADVPNYSFDSQFVYPVDSAPLDVGDSVRTRCTYENTSASPVQFGEDTADEMCFNFIGYYPRVTAPTWSWLLPAYSANCTTY
ncbi:MAG: peptidylglycine alpha-amidating monooxygenase [Polyangiaceae bacterium]